MSEHEKQIGCFILSFFALILFQLCYHLAGLNLLAFGNIDSFHSSCSRCKYVCLHLHGLDNSNWLICLNLLAFLYENYYGETKEEDYLNDSTEEDRIMKKIYLSLKDRDFASIDEIDSLLSEKGLKELISSF